MKVEFKKSENEANQELVFVNEILEGVFYFEAQQSAFVYAPTTGPHIVIPHTYDEARQTLIGKLSQLYH